MSSPISWAWPSVSRSNPINPLTRVLLPQPDSPTMPTVLPLRMRREMSSTAFT